MKMSTPSDKVLRKFEHKINLGNVKYSVLYIEIVTKNRVLCINQLHFSGHKQCSSKKLCLNIVICHFTRMSFSPPI